MSQFPKIIRNEETVHFVNFFPIHYRVTKIPLTSTYCTLVNFCFLRFVKSLALLEKLGLKTEYMPSFVDVQFECPLSCEFFQILEFCSPIDVKH